MYLKNVVAGFNQFVWPFNAGLCAAFLIVYVVKADPAPAVFMAGLAAVNTFLHFFINREK